MKHIDIREHFIRDSVNRRLVDVLHIPGVENPADLLTKPLHRSIHLKWLTRLNMHLDLPIDNALPVPSGQGSQGGVGD
jgi:hypothetical protein